jgi:hypothetical protein
MRVTPLQWRVIARPVLLAMTVFTVVVAVRVLGEPRGAWRPPPVERVALGDVAGAPEGGGQEWLFLPPGHPPIGELPELPPGHPPIAPRLPAGHPPIDASEAPTVDGPGRPMPVFSQGGTSTT